MFQNNKYQICWQHTISLMCSKWELNHEQGSCKRSESLAQRMYFKLTEMFTRKPFIQLNKNNSLNLVCQNDTTYLINFKLSIISNN